jgi:hypothetical protein
MSTTYTFGATRHKDKQLVKAIRTAQNERERLARKLGGVRNELQAMQRAQEIIRNAEKQAQVIREQAYDFGLAQLDRDYPTRQDRNRERQRAKNTLVKHWAHKRLEAATTEADQWESKRAA